MTTQSHRIFNLTFHGLGIPDRPLEANEANYWIEAEKFTRVLDEIAQWTETRITFDDGNMSDLSIAAPLLTSRGIQATFFVVAGRIGQRAFLGRNELRELSAAGMQIGSHGMHHQSWRRLPMHELTREICDARALLEDMLGAPVTQAACPFGEYGKRVLNLLARSGFTRVYTSDRGWAKPEAWFQPRNTIGCATDIENVKMVRNWGWPTRLVQKCKAVIKQYR